MSMVKPKPDEITEVSERPKDERTEQERRRDRRERCEGALAVLEDELESLLARPYDTSGAVSIAAHLSAIRYLREEIQHLR